MISLLSALPINHHGSVLRRRKLFCGSSALSASSITVSPSSKRSWCCGCRTSSICSQSRHERGETWLMEKEGWRACYGQIEQLAKELEMPSAMLTDRQGWGGMSGQGFHCANMKFLLDRTAHRTRSDKGALLRQPDRPSLTLYHPCPSPLLERLPQPQHQGRYPFDC